MSTVAAVRAKAKALARGEPSELRTRILALAKTGDEQLAFEIARASKMAVLAMTARDVESMLGVLHDWCSTDCFACFISGVAWREGVLADAIVMKWTASDNLWTRRAALASTIPLNSRARGSKQPAGDADRTLAICERLVDDREDMIVKALSWALRELARRNRAAVVAFLDRHRERLAARVRREVNNILTTGLKNPKRPTEKTTKRTRP